MAVIDDITGRSSSSTTVLAHFLDRANVAVAAEDVLRYVICKLWVAFDGKHFVKDIPQRRSAGGSP